MYEHDDLILRYGWLEVFHLSVFYFYLMDLRRYRIPAVFFLLRNVDCREHILSQVALVNLVNMTLASSVLRSTVLQHLQLRMNTFLAPFGEPYALRETMRMTCSTVFDASSLVFITQLVEKYQKYNVLHLSVGLGKEQVLIDELRKIGYARNHEAEKSRELRRHRVNPFCNRQTMYTRSKENIHILVALSVDKSALMPCLGVACSALMNSVGPDSVWMGYPRWTFANHAVSNTILHLKEKIDSYVGDVRESERVVSNLGVHVWNGYHKLKCQFRRVPPCGTKDCPQARRANDDVNCLYLFFANVRDSELEKEVWMERDKGGYGVMWRMSGIKCFKDTEVMEPFAVPIRSLTGRKDWQNSYVNDTVT